MVKIAAIGSLALTGLFAAAFNEVAGLEFGGRRPAMAVVSASAPASASQSDPVVTSLRTKAFKVGDQPQVLAAIGKNFETGMTATLSAPLGGVTTFPAGAISDLTTTSFALSAALDEPGTYFLSVRNPSGRRSNTIPIVVKR